LHQAKGQFFGEFDRAQTGREETGHWHQGQPIKVGRFEMRVAVPPKMILPELIEHDEQYVLGFHESSLRVAERAEFIE
tara:strand:+ start:2366 stop:2599 length:234 start_codon:yes stop_codon:yes gene_type:complete